MLKRIVLAALTAALLVAGGVAAADAAGQNGKAPVIHKSASAVDDGSTGGRDSVNAMDLQEWYDLVNEHQRQGNVQWACDCSGFVLAKWRGRDGHARKLVEYPAANFDGTTNPYGDIIRYRQGNLGRWSTDKVKYLTRDGDAFPFYYNAAGGASTR